MHVARNSVRSLSNDGLATKIRIGAGACRTPTYHLHSMAFSTPITLQTLMAAAHSSASGQAALDQALSCPTHASNVNAHVVRLPSLRSRTARFPSVQMLPRSSFGLALTLTLESTIILQRSPNG